MIKIDMDMPKSCSNCDLLYDCMSCIVTGSKVDFDNYDTTRLSDCPLEDMDDEKT